MGSGAWLLPISTYPCWRWQSHQHFTVKTLIQNTPFPWRDSLFKRVQNCDVMQVCALATFSPKCYLISTFIWSCLVRFPNPLASSSDWVQLRTVVQDYLQHPSMIFVCSCYLQYRPVQLRAIEPGLACLVARGPTTDCTCTIFVWLLFSYFFFFWSQISDFYFLFVACPAALLNASCTCTNLPEPLLSVPHITYCSSTLHFAQSLHLAQNLHFFS